MASNIVKIEASGDGSDATAMIAEITGNITSPKTVVFPSAEYNVSGRIPFSDHGIEIVGAGRWGTRFNFNPTTPSVLFDFEYRTPGAILVNCSLKNIRVVPSGTVHKIPIRLGYCRSTRLENVWISQCTSTGYDSIGLQIQGQDLNLFTNLFIDADTPISIEQNQYHDCSLDQTDFYHTYLQTRNPAGAGVLIAPGSMLFDVRFEGETYFAGGKYSIYWVDPTPPVYPYWSSRLTLNNGRHEAPADATGYGIYIDGPDINHMKINNWVADPAMNGFLLRNVRHLTMEHCEYMGHKEALNLDATSKNIVLSNCQLVDSYFNPDATISMTGLTRTFNQPPIEIWQPS